MSAEFAGITIGLNPGCGNAGTNYAFWTNLAADSAALGLRWWRIQLSWCSIELTQGVYSWSVLDNIVQNANNYGINLLYTLRDAPSWGLTQLVTSEPWYLPNPNASSDTTSMAYFAKKVATRYKPGSPHGTIQAIGFNEDFNIHNTSTTDTLVLTQNLTSGVPVTSFTIAPSGFTPLHATKLYINGYGSSDVAVIATGHDMSLNDTSVTVNSITPGSNYTLSHTLTLNQTVTNAGGPYTSITINAAGQNEPKGAVIYFNGLNGSDHATLSSAMTAGDTVMHVNSFTPGVTYNAGQVLNCADIFLNISYIGYNASTYTGLYNGVNGVTSSGKQQPARDPHYASTLLQHVYNNIKNVDPSFLVGAPCTWWLQPVNGGVPNTPTSNHTAFLTQLYTDGCKGFFDFVDAHYYSNAVDPNTGSSQVNTIGQMITDFQTVTAANGEPNKPIWVTEFNWQVPTDTTSTVQASRMTEVLNAVIPTGNPNNNKVFPFTLDYKTTGASQDTLINWNGTTYVPTQTYAVYRNFIAAATRTGSQSSQYREIVLTDNPIAYYRLGDKYLDANTGKLARDESANYYDGNANGTVNVNTLGAITSNMKSMSFNGTTGYISTATTGLPLGAALWSVEAWGYTTNAASVSTQTLAGFGSTGANQMAVIQFVNAGAGCFAQVNISGTVAAGSAGSIVSNTWYHVVGTYDGAHIALYVNGAFVAQTTATPNLTQFFCQIGATGNPPANWFIGRVDEAAIYGYALTSSQVATHYNRAVATSPVATYQQTILADVPLGYWRLEETSGTTASDLGSLAHNGTLNGGITLAQTGAIGNDPNTGMTFDGSTGYFALPSGLSLNGSSAFTIECWCLPNATFATSGRLVASDDVNVNHKGFALTAQPNCNGINFEVGNGTTDFLANTATVLSSTAYSHVVGVWDGTNIFIYLNGTSAASAAAAITLANAGFSLNIGRSPTNANYFPGAIDEVAIYNYALSATQISNHYSAGTNSTIGPWHATISRGPSIFVEAGSLMLDRAVGRRSQASFTVKHDTLTHFQQYQPAEVYDHNSVLYFSGYIMQPRETKPGFQASLHTQVVCSDRHFVTDKRVVFNGSTNLARTYSGIAISAIVGDLYTTYLAPEGIAQGNIATLGTTRNATFTWPTLSQALDALATAASISGQNWYWFISEDGRFYFQPYNTTLNLITVDGTLIDQMNKPPYVIRANPLYRNYQYAIYGSSPFMSSNVNSTEQTNQAAIDHTTGIIENVVKDTSIANSTDGNNECLELNDRNAIRGKLFQFTTRATNLAPGQQITVNYGPFGFAGDTMLIENVHVDDSGDGFNMWYTVTAVEGPYDQTWQQFFEHAFAAPQQLLSINAGV